MRLTLLSIPAAAGHDTMDTMEPLSRSPHLYLEAVVMMGTKERKLSIIFVF